MKKIQDSWPGLIIVLLELGLFVYLLTYLMDLFE